MTRNPGTGARIVSMSVIASRKADPRLKVAMRRPRLTFWEGGWFAPEMMALAEAVAEKDRRRTSPF